MGRLGKWGDWVEKRGLGLLTDMHEGQNKGAAGYPGETFIFALVDTSGIKIPRGGIITNLNLLRSFDLT